MTLISMAGFWVDYILFKISFDLLHLETFNKHTKIPYKYK